MKKIAKLLLASSMLAALVLACNNGSGLVAHDELDAPDVEAYATASGVIVLEWDAVKDAKSYTVTVKNPGQEYFTAAPTELSSVAVTAGVYRYVYSYDQADAEYEFRVVASTDASLMLAGVTEVSVTTPDEEDIEDGLAEIALNVTLEKEEGSANRYKVIHPVDLGYKYSGGFIKSHEMPNNDAEIVYKRLGSTSYNEEGVNAFTTIENADGDDILVFDNVTDDTDNQVGSYYFVLCAEPLNAKFAKFGAKKLYALSSAVSLTNADVDDNLYGVWAQAIKGTVTIHINLADNDSIGNSYNKSAPAASTFTVWQKEEATVETWTSGSLVARTVNVAWDGKTPKQIQTLQNEAEYEYTFATKNGSVTTSVAGTTTTYRDFDYKYYFTYTNKKGDKVWKGMVQY